MRTASSKSRAARHNVFCSDAWWIDLAWPTQPQSFRAGRALWSIPRTSSADLHCPCKSMTMRSAFAAPRAEFRLPACRRRGSPASSPLPPDGAPVPIRGDSLGTSSFASTVTISQPHEHDAASKAERRQFAAARSLRSSQICPTHFSLPPPWNARSAVDRSRRHQTAHGSSRGTPALDAVTTGPLVFATGSLISHSPERGSCRRRRARRGHDRTDHDGGPCDADDVSGLPTGLLATRTSPAQRRHHGRTRPRGNEWAGAGVARVPRRAVGSLLPRPRREHPRAIHARDQSTGWSLRTRARRARRQPPRWRHRRSLAAWPFHLRLVSLRISVRGGMNWPVYLPADSHDVAHAFSYRSSNAVAAGDIPRTRFRSSRLDRSM